MIKKLGLGIIKNSILNNIPSRELTSTELYKYSTFIYNSNDYISGTKLKNKKNSNNLVLGNNPLAITNVVPFHLSVEEEPYLQMFRNYSLLSKNMYYRGYPDATYENVYAKLSIPSNITNVIAILHESDIRKIYIDYRVNPKYLVYRTFYFNTNTSNNVYYPITVNDTSNILNSGTWWIGTESNKNQNSFAFKVKESKSLTLPNDMTDVSTTPDNYPPNFEFASSTRGLSISHYTTTSFILTSTFKIFKIIKQSNVFVSGAIPDTYEFATETILTVQDHFFSYSSGYFNENGIVVKSKAMLYYYLNTVSYIEDSIVNSPKYTLIFKLKNPVSYNGDVLNLPTRKGFVFSTVIYNTNTSTYSGSGVAAYVNNASTSLFIDIVSNDVVVNTFTIPNYVQLDNDFVIAIKYDGIKVSCIYNGIELSYNIVNFTTHSTNIVLNNSQNQSNSIIDFTYSGTVLFYSAYYIKKDLTSNEINLITSSYL